MVFGDIIYEGKGKAVINRIVEGGDGIITPKIEMTLHGQGSYRGVPTTEIWTFITHIKNDDSSFNEGQGIIFTMDKFNRDMVVVSGRGVGKNINDGDMVYHGHRRIKDIVVVFSVRNMTGRHPLGFLHNMLGLNEFTLNEETMEYTNKLIEWK